VSVRVEGLDELRDDLREAAARADDPRPVLEEFAAKVVQLVVRSFASQASPEGQAWAPRRTTTRSRVGRPEHPRRRVQGRKLGELTGAMRRSVETEVTARAVILEVGADHAPFFVGGTRHQPERPFVPLGDEGASKDAVDELGEQLADHLVEPLRA
jgi:phage gpG-like protein